MIEQRYLEDCLLQLKRLKTQGERAFGQVSDKDFFAALDAEANSIALIMKHLAGNMRSRWTDFLSSDGEKPNRNRDSEFERLSGDSRSKIMAWWEDGWNAAFKAISALRPADLDRTLTIRGEPHSVLQAVNRQMTHYAAHIGQIVLLAKHFAGGSWKTLSIPRGKSKEFEVSKPGEQIAQQPGKHPAG